MMNPVIQEETTGCGIAAVANIVGKSYAQMRLAANAIGIYAEDEALWSDTQYVRTLLANEGVQTSPNEAPFESWNSLPNMALLSIKHYEESGKCFWHWVVFKRCNNKPIVLDSASYLSNNIRTDFAAMAPKWFIEVHHE